MTSREKNRVLKSETLNLFQNKQVNSLSLPFCHSSSNSVSIPIYFVGYLPFLPIHLLISLLPVICFKLPITGTFSISLEGSSYRESTVFKNKELPRYASLILPILVYFKCHKHLNHKTYNIFHSRTSDRLKYLSIYLHVIYRFFWQYLRYIYMILPLEPLHFTGLSSIFTFSAPNIYTSFTVTFDIL